MDPIRCWALALSISAVGCASKSGPVEAPRETHAETDAAHLVAVLVSPQSDFAARVAAERALRALPANRVVPRIDEQPLATMPTGPIFNSGGSAEADEGGPWEWQVYYALHRVRYHHVHNAR